MVQLSVNELLRVHGKKLFKINENSVWKHSGVTIFRQTEVVIFAQVGKEDFSVCQAKQSVGSLTSLFSETEFSDV